MPRLKKTTPENPSALMAVAVRRKLASAKCRASTLAGALRFINTYENAIPEEEAKRIHALLDGRLRKALTDPNASGSLLEVAHKYYTEQARKGLGGAAPGVAGAPMTSDEVLEKIGRAFLTRGLTLPFPLPQTLADPLAG